MKMTIEQALQQGVAAHKEGKLQEAERIYRAILQAHPTNPDANHNLGVLAVSVNQAEAAVPLFKIALEANPKINQFWLSYIDALIRDNQIENAKQILERAKTQGVAGEKYDTLSEQLVSASDDSSPPQSELNSLIREYQNGRYDEAEKLAISITEKFPNHQFSWKILGAIFGQTSRKSKAVNANLRAAQLAPQDAEAHSNLGVTLKDLGRLEEAEASYRQAILLNSEYAEAHNYLGNTLQKLGRLKEAKKSYYRAIAIKPGYAEAHNNLGATLQEIGKFVEAETSYRKSIALKFDYAEAHNNLGNTLNKLGRLAEAEVSCRQAISLNPDLAEAHNNLGASLEKLGRLEEADASYRRAIILKPDFAEAHSNLGITLQDVGRLKEAEVGFRQAIALKPNYAKARYNLGVLLFLSGEYCMAAEQFDLIDFDQSKLYAIRCSYLQDEKNMFYEKLDLLISQGEINAVIGSLIFCSEIKYGIKKSNPFCNDPLRYVVKTDLNEKYDFENIFITTARDVLVDNSVSRKVQSHLTHGIQTAGNIFALERVFRTKIEIIIRAEIENYRNHFEGSEEGFIKNWPTSYNISGWLVCMRNGGKLDSHMHDEGWITGSVYINVPQKSNPNSGNLVLCSSDKDHVHGIEDKQESIINVVTGSLCLFPSSLHHCTVPFEEDENRIVLAFDVIRNQ